MQVQVQVQVHDAARRDRCSPRIPHAMHRRIDTIGARVHVDARAVRRGVRGEVRAPGHHGGEGAGQSEAADHGVHPTPPGRSSPDPRNPHARPDRVQAVSAGSQAAPPGTAGLRMWLTAHGIDATEPAKQRRERRKRLA